MRAVFYSRFRGVFDSLQVVDWDAGTVEIEMPIPAVGLSPALSKLLRIAARNDVAVALTET
jgi:hypothetical protein